MFLLKKIVTAFILPFPLCLGLLLLGAILLWVRRTRNYGRAILTAAVLGLLLLSWGPFSDLLLRPLENRYPPLFSQNPPAVEWIVVLGGGHTSDPRVPPTSQLTESSLSRLVEGIRLHRSLPGSKLILSGGVVIDPVPEAVTLEGAALALGVEKKELVLESEARDTEEQAVRIGRIVGGKPFILVTSAAHMPRSVALFRKAGMDPIPAPTDYKVKENQGKGGLAAFFDQRLGQVRKAEIAVYEYLGIAWSKVRGRS